MQQHTNIDVTKESDFPQAQFHVQVGAGEEAASFEVTVSEDYWHSLTGGEMIPEVLLEKSFVFLLSREPKEAILASFDLKEIEEYFPDYSDVVAEL